MRSLLLIIYVIVERNKTHSLHAFSKFGKYNVYFIRWGLAIHTTRCHFLIQKPTPNDISSKTREADVSTELFTQCLDCLFHFRTTAANISAPLVLFDYSLNKDYLSLLPPQSKLTHALPTSYTTVLYNETNRHYDDATTTTPTQPPPRPPAATIRRLACCFHYHLPRLSPLLQWCTVCRT